MSAASSSAARRARGVVVDWTALVVRGLPDAVARDRLDQVLSDLHEQTRAFERDGRSGAALAVSVLSRLVRGVPSDVAWRVSEAHRARRSPGGGKELVMSRKHRSPAAKPWTPLVADGEQGGFDQTNGVVDFDAKGARPDDDPSTDLLGKAVASNTVNVGFFGGGMS